MTRLTKGFVLFLAALLTTLTIQNVAAQSVIDPTDPVINYDSTHPPTPPGWMQMGKWVRTPNQAVADRNPGWNTNVYKAYIWQNLSFRVEFPKTYNPTANDGKKYPVIIFLHGKGEIATPPLYKYPYNYDNEFQLLQGPHEFDAAIQNGTYDGYVIAPQVEDLFYYGDFVNIMGIVDYMVANNKVDPFHIVVNGLSGGGTAVWDLFNYFPQYVSSATPMSSPITFTPDSSYISNKRFTPIWLAQGGLDTNPSPATTQSLQDSMMKYGANFKRTVYPNTGHGTWYNFWAEPDFWPFVNRSYMSNPWMLGGLKSYWPGEPFKDTIGVMPGFTAYQWRYNGNVLANQTGNTLVVTAPGIYEARVEKGSLWSDWSHVPLNIRTGFYEAENYTAMSGVQTEATTDVGGGLNVGYINNGDWMDYTLNVYSAGTYTLDLRVASQFSGGTFQIRNADSAVLATVTVPATGGWQDWTTVSTTVTLPAGTQNIRIKSIADAAWNINWLQFLIPQNSPLPVRFVYFNAQCRNGAVNLQWKTAQEQNSKNFSVQKSTDGLGWKEIASQAAAGQSNDERSYAYTDKASSSNSLYRIVEYDIDGKMTISNIVTSACSSKYGISLFPNPTAGNSALNINLEQSTNVKVQVIDTKGAVMQQRQLMLPSGNSTISLDMFSYPRGVYTVNIYYNNEVKTIKMIKK